MATTEFKEIVIYCDGACHPNPGGTGGWAAILKHGDRLKEISGAVPQTTNNRMELTAALQALELLSKPSKVTVYTDSQYLCNSFNKKWLDGWKRNGWVTSQKSPVLNQDLWQKLLVQAARHQITWIWVRGHADNFENNRCDQLAVEARKVYDLENPK